MSRKQEAFVIAVEVAAVLAIVLVAARRPASEPPPEARFVDARFVGSQACAGCHAAEHAAWSSSHHRHAMEPASAGSVRGNFDDVTFRYFGRETRFSRSGASFQVTTENQQGRPETFTVTYTLGYAPLQQYLVAFPDGRLQALPFAWDTRPRAQGGQRWFHLYPDSDVGPSDPLFWMRPRQNWNHMCGDCHTTAFSKRFSDETGTQGRFDSRWSEVGNGCESCHGAGSAHVAAMTTTPTPPQQGRPIHLSGLHTQAEQFDQCGVCHARRIRLREDPSHERMHDTWRPELLTDGLYFTDGQIRDEVFEMGSFLQSKMAARGITCSHCHDPHTAKLRAEGNALCTQCHDRQVFDGSQHHFHRAGTDGARCVNCHMPSRTYMVVHERRDHRIAVPRPDLTDQLGTPNACGACHADRSAAWATEAIRAHASGRRQGPSAAERFGPTLARVRSGTPEGAATLGAFLADADSMTAGIAKATALASLATGQPPQTPVLALVQPHLRAADPWLRLGAVHALAATPVATRAATLAPLAADPVPSVRLAAAPLLIGADEKPPREVSALFAEYRAWLAANGDRPEALVAQATLHSAEGDGTAARAAFERALQLDETSLVAHLNFADHLRGTGDDAGAESLLRKACALYPESADAHHALGLALVRRRQASEGVRELARASELAPGNTYYAYVYRIGLESAHQRDQASSGR